MESTLPVVLGFFLGVRHASDADHVIAVTTIVSRERRLGPAALIGVLWGTGHGLAIALVGGAILLFSLTVPPPVSLTMELSVAVMLIALGVMNLAAGADGRPSNAFGAPRSPRLLRPLLVGAIHGLAGSAPLALLAAALIPEPLSAIAYLLLFVTGTLMAMMVVTLAVAMPFACTRARSAPVNRWLGLASGLLSLGFGLFLAYRIGFVEGLLGGPPG